MIKNNKGLIMFYVIIIVVSLVWVNYVAKDNDRMNTAKLQERS